MVRFTLVLTLALVALAMIPAASAQNGRDFRQFSWDNPVANVLPDAPEAIPQQKKPLTLQPEEMDGAAPLDPSEIPEVLLKEMESVERDCSNNTFYSSFHDCKCLAVKFLDVRMVSPPHKSKEAVFQTIANECPNEAGIAGHIFKSCVDVMRRSRPDDFDSFCTCAANKVAADYTKRPELNVRYIDDLRKVAFISCGLGNEPGQ